MNRPNPACIIVTGRALIGDALLSALEARKLDFDLQLHVSTAPSRSFAPRRHDALLLDLEGLTPTPTFVASAARAARRVAVFDEFTPSIAQAGFEIGVNALWPLDGTLDELLQILVPDATVQAVRIASPGPALERLRALDHTQLDMLQLLAAGHSSGAVARMTGTSERSTATVKRSILTTLGVHTIADAISLAMQAGLPSVVNQPPQRALPRVQPQRALRHRYGSDPPTARR